MRLDASHLREVDRNKCKEHAAVLLNSLIEAGLVVEAEEGAGLDTELSLAANLQEDFSVFNSLALYLLHALVLERVLRHTPAWPDPLPGVTFLAMSISLAWALAQLVERPFQRALR